MATHLQMNKMETELMMDHHQLVRLLEMEYTNHICQLLKQKNMILTNLQQQFIEQRNKIKQTFENQQNKANVLNPLTASLSNEPMPRDYAEIKVNPIEICDTYVPNEIVPSMSEESISEKMTSLVNDLDSNKSNSCIIQMNPFQISHLLPKDLENKQNENKQSKNKKQKLRKDTSKRCNSKKDHQCPHCEYSAATAANLKTHIRTHTGEKPFVCTFGDCKKRFSQKNNLKRHMKRHKGDKNFKCSFCDKAFVEKHDMTRHMRVHTGERPFECKHCKKRFKDRSNLRNHTKNVHAK